METYGLLVRLVLLEDLHLAACYLECYHQVSGFAYLWQPPFYFSKQAAPASLIGNSITLPSSIAFLPTLVRNQESHVTPSIPSILAGAVLMVVEVIEEFQ
jgi:hypothetical protein